MPPAPRLHLDTAEELACRVDDAYNVGMKTIAFVDMDGVLVDFVAGVLKHFGREHIPHRDIQWGIEEQMGCTKDEFWGQLGHLFWANLPWTNEGKALLDGVRRICGDNIVILTSPSRTPGCVDGKLDWVRREIPALADSVIMCKRKGFVAHSNAVLLDDHNKNVDEFSEAGGRTLLIPRPWNRRKDETCPLGRFDVAKVLDELMVA